MIIFSFFIFWNLTNSLHNRPGPVAYEYEITISIAYSPLSSSALSVILLTFSLNTLHNSLMNFCCDLVIALLFSTRLKVFNFDFLFDDTFFLPFFSCHHDGHLRNNCTFQVSARSSFVFFS